MKLGLPWSELFNIIFWPAGKKILLRIGIKNERFNHWLFYHKIGTCTDYIYLVNINGAILKRHHKSLQL